MFGGAVDGSIEVVTPTLLTRNVIRKLREADAKANAILKEMGRATADRMYSASHIGQPPMHKCIAVCLYWQKFCVTLFCKCFKQFDIIKENYVNTYFNTFSNYRGVAI